MPNRLTKIRQGIAAGFKQLPFSFPNYAVGYGGSLAGLYGLLSGSTFDYRREAGKVYDNAVVFSGIQFITRAFNEAPLCVQKKNSQGKWEYYVPVKRNDPLARLVANWNRPNKHYSGKKLAAGILLSYLSRGNGYAYKVRNPLDELIGYIYIPHFHIEPWVAPGSGDFITDYLYTAGGKQDHFPVEDVLHLRYNLNPENMRLGLEPTYATMREICTDNTISSYEGSLLRNSGVPSLHIQPEMVKGEDGDMVVFGPSTANKYRQLVSEQYGGENVGGVIVSKTPTKIEPVGFNPSDMSIGSMRPQNVERILSPLGLDPMVLGYESKSKTYSNYEEAWEGAYKNAVVPLWVGIAEELDYAVLEEYVPETDVLENYRIWFDTREVKALQEDLDNLHARAREDYEAGIIPRKTAKRMIGEEYDEVKDDVYSTDFPGKAAKPTDADGTGKKEGKDGA